MLNAKRLLCGLIFFAAIPVLAGEIESLEQKVIERAESEPDTSYEYFMEKIEAGASIEEQAVYLYGMGIAREKQGNIGEAINDYLSAEALGYSKATEALERLR
ncbi:MAG: hypothetical protein H6867_04725 [Rhodospirillales bacterium]|nr:hypothetical protein [Rhodospirillales bacterium]MCB9994805.1 hypothetical protein [Rhodospirillales bacterium]